MSKQIGNDFNPFENVWDNDNIQKEEINEINGKQTKIIIKENKLDLSKIVLTKKDSLKN